MEEMTNEYALAPAVLYNGSQRELVEAAAGRTYLRGRDVIAGFSFECFSEFDHCPIGIIDIFLGARRCGVTEERREPGDLGQSSLAQKNYFLRLFSRTGRCAV
jgi:hypothetical protein